MSLKSLLCLAWILTPGPAAADWLVLHDGTKLETAGRWEIEGALVVFTLPSGTLASIPVRSVDFERTVEGPELEMAGETLPSRKRRVPSREPVLVLTDRDLPPPASPEARREAPMSTPSQVRVESWVEIDRPGSDGVEIVGRARNGGVAAVRISCIAVALRDQEGAPIQTEVVLPEESLLAAGGSTTFHARFPAVHEILERPSFRIFTDGGLHRCLFGA